MQRSVPLAPATATCHVVQAVKSAEITQSDMDRCRRRFRISRVRRKRNCILPQLLFRQFDLRFITSEDDDSCALRDERLGRGESQAAGASNGDQDFIGESAHALWIAEFSAWRIRLP